jgi:putative DNA primase/helicase
MKQNLTHTLGVRQEPHQREHGVYARPARGYDVETSAIIAQKLGLRQSGKRFVGVCPSCGYPDALVVQDGNWQPLIYCHACRDPDAVRLALRRGGVFSAPRREKAQSRNHGRKPARTDLIALKIWGNARNADGTPVETYLRCRGINIKLPPTLRFAPHAAHRPSGNTFPAMIAAVTVWPERKPCAVHRTFLDYSGTDKAPVEPERMTLGPCGGAAVRLAEATDRLMVGEGIETCLSAMQGTGLPAWAALSTGGLQTMKLPPEVREVIILADGDEPGEKAAQAAARRFLADQRRVRIARPPKGSDFNDVLQGRAPTAGAAQ